MGSLVISDVEDGLKSALEARATSNGRSVQEEAKRILSAALSQDRLPRTDLVEAIRRHLRPLGGGVDLELPERELPRDPQIFD